MHSKTLLGMIAALTGFLPQTLSAAAPLSADALLQHCSAYSKDSQSEAGRLCVVYIQGFIDGAVTADARIAKAPTRERESWLERVARTRLGIRRDSPGRSRYGEYCLGEPVPVQDIIQHVIDYLEVSPPDGKTPARDVVGATLRQHYSCPRVR